MLKKDGEKLAQVEIFSVEDFVPQDHLLRKIASAVDFNHLYDIVDDLYCKDNGRPSIDPVVLFKMVLIQHIYGIPSLRKTAEEVKMNVAYRWFLGYLMNDVTPHFSTVSYNFLHRFTSETVEQIFYFILRDIAEAGYLSTDSIFVDGTHIKANANMKKVVKKVVPVTARVYEKQLREEINADREEHGKKTFDNDDENKPTKTKTINESTTDPESGVFHKGEHKKCLAYSAQTACDKNGYVLDVTVNPGNMHDSVAFNGLYDRITEVFPEIENVVMDAGYRNNYIAKKVIDDGRVPVLPYKRPMTKRGFFKSYEYVYDEKYDCVLCPNDQILKYATTNKEGYKEFKSDPNICCNCPHLNQCTLSSNHTKVVMKSVWQKYDEMVEDYRHMPKYKALYEQRKETIERVFADAKEKHGMRYTQYRGLATVTKWVRLKFVAMNLKKYALHKARVLLIMFVKCIKYHKIGVTHLRIVA